MPQSCLNRATMLSFSFFFKSCHNRVTIVPSCPVSLCFWNRATIVPQSRHHVFFFVVWNRATIVPQSRHHVLLKSCHNRATMVSFFGAIEKKKKEPNMVADCGTIWGQKQKFDIVHRLWHDFKKKLKKPRSWTLCHDCGTSSDQIVSQSCNLFFRATIQQSCHNGIARAAMFSFLLFLKSCNNRATMFSFFGAIPIQI